MTPRFCSLLWALFITVGRDNATALIPGIQHANQNSNLNQVDNSILDPTHTADWDCTFMTRDCSERRFLRSFGHDRITLDNRKLEDINDNPNNSIDEEVDVQEETTTTAVSRNTTSVTRSSKATRTVPIVACLIFLFLGAWFCYHYFLEKVQEMVYDEAVKTAKQDLLSSVAKLTEENVVVFNKDSEPVNGTYCAVYLEPQLLECGSTDMERKYEINLKFEKDLHQDDESSCSLEGWSINGSGIDPAGNPFKLESGFVTKLGQACWTENRVGLTVLCNGRFNFYKRTFSGAWIARNGCGGEFIRFYHKTLSVYSNIDMDNYAYKGPLHSDEKSVDENDEDRTKTTMTDDSHTIIDVSDGYYAMNDYDQNDENDDTRIIEVRYPAEKRIERPVVKKGQKPIENKMEEPVEKKMEKPIEKKTENTIENAEQQRVPKLQTLNSLGKLRPIDEESTLVSVPIAIVTTMSRDSADSTCSGLSASYSSFRRRDDIDSSDQAE